MGSWTSFTVDGYQLSTTKSYADPETLSLFREADKRVRLRASHDGESWESPWLSAHVAAWSLREDGPGRVVVALPDGAQWERNYEENEDAHGATPTVGPPSAPEYDGVVDCAYVASVAQVRDRLDVMGFTRAAAEETIHQFVAAELEGLESLLAEEDDPYGIARRDRDALLGLTFDAWLEAFRWIKGRGAHALDEERRHRDTSFHGYYVRANEVTPTVRYLLDSNLYEHHLGFPTDDIRHLYRAALEVCPAEGEVCLDLSDLVGGGYYEPWQPVVDEARAARAARYPADAPTIVLTEGITDQRALRAAIGILYPHLIDLYSFTDFEAMRVRGGAPALVAMVKGFAGAGVVNRVVALFDNDTAAHAAVRELRDITLPPNMRVLHFPPLPLAAAYPTVGPHGLQVMDVNGTATSLEMYFGEDVLRNGPEGALIPVRWGSMEWTLQRYQGELRDKAAAQERFAAKVAAAEEDPGVIPMQDWSGMRAILDMLRKAFDALNCAE